jgi:hypothetical protein
MIISIETVIISINTAIISMEIVTVSTDEAAVSIDAAIISTGKMAGSAGNVVVFAEPQGFEVVNGNKYESVKQSSTGVSKWFMIPANQFPQATVSASQLILFFDGTQAAKRRHMKDNSFAMAMEKIVGQAEAEQRQEVRAQRRSQIFSRVRGVFSLLLVATVAVFVFCYRMELQNLIFSRPAAKQAAGETAAGGTAAGIKAAQDNAATRDRVVNEITK